MVKSYKQLLAAMFLLCGVAPIRAEEAIEFYRKSIGAEVVMLAHFKDAPPDAAGPLLPPDWGNKVMHARIRIGTSTILLSDGCPDKKEAVQGFTLSLTAPDPAAAEKVFAALGQGEQVLMPLMKTFFSPAFGMVKDPFGVPWMVYVEPAR